MIKNRADLITFINGESERHQQVDGYRCSCGFDCSEFAGRDLYGAGEMTWSRHFDTALVDDLGYNLPSNEGGTDGPVSWEESYEAAYRVIDHFHRHCTCDIDFSELC